MTKRISLEVSDEVYERLEQPKEARKTTLSDVFRRAIGTETFFDEQVRTNKNQILLQDPDGKTRQVIWERS